MENRETIKFGIVKIATEQFATIPEVLRIGEPIQIKHDLNFGADKDNKGIYVKKTAHYQHPDSSVFLIIAVACHFSIKPDSWDMLKFEESERIKLPRDFAIHLAMLTVGTLRGILHAKTENTEFNRYIFPTFNVTSLIPETVILE